MTFLIQKKPLFPEILWSRPVHSYKKAAGSVFLVAGSRGKSNEPFLAAESAFRSGTGLLTLGFPAGLASIYKGLIPEAFSLPLPETPGYTLSKKGKDQILEYAKGVTLVLLGPGLSTNAETLSLIWELLFEIQKPIIVDTDALISFSLGIKLLNEKVGEEGVKEYLKKRTRPTIIVANKKEILEILKALGYKFVSKTKRSKLDVKYLENNKKQIIPDLANLLNMYIVLTEGDILIAEPNGRKAINKNEHLISVKNNIFTGVISSFVSQNLAPTEDARTDKIFESICTAAYLYNLAVKMGRKGKENIRVHSSDIIKKLPEAIKKAEEEI